MIKKQVKESEANEVRAQEARKKQVTQMLDQVKVSN